MTRRNKIILIGVLLAAASALSYFLLRQNKIKALQDTITNKQKQLKGELESSHALNYFEQQPTSTLLTTGFGLAKKDSGEIHFKTASEQNLYQQAIAAFDNKNYSKAIQNLSTLSKLYRNKFLFEKLGEAYMKNEEYSKAIEQFDLAINVDYKYAMAYLNRGYSKAQLQFYSEAIADCKSCIRYDSSNYNAYNNWGVNEVNNQNVAPAHRRDIERAKRYFTQAIIFHPDGSDTIYYNRGCANLQLNIIDEAATDFTSCLRINPENADAYYLRGITFMDFSKWKDALSDFTLALAKNTKYQKEAEKYKDEAQEMVRLEEEQTKLSMTKIN